LTKSNALESRPESLPSEASAGGATRAKRRYLTASERRVEILAAARTVFAAQGFEGARMREIADEANANVATLFQHFDSKKSLFSAAVLEPLERFVALHHDNARLFSAADPEQRWPSAIETYKIRLELMVEIFPILTAALFASHDRGREFYETVLYPKLLQLGAFTLIGIPDIEQHGIDPMLLTLGMFGMDFMLVMDGHFRNVRPDLAAAASLFVTMVRARLAAPADGVFTSDSEQAPPSTQIAGVEEQLQRRIAELEAENVVLRRDLEVAARGGAPVRI
jgi:AcrR family transcriptional regulator